MKFANEAFRFKQFSVLVYPDVFPISTDSVLLGSWIDLGQSQKILDIGTGSGLLALMVAQKSVDQAVITAIDMDEIAVKCSKYNFEQSPWFTKANIKCLNASTLLNPVFENQNEFKFDLLISNPPYFADSLLSPEAAKNRTRHQTTLNYKMLADIANACLIDTGKMCLVLPYSDEDLFVKLMYSNKFHPSRILRVRNKRQTKIKRVLMEFSKTKDACVEMELFLYDEDGQRSMAYSELTKDFYI